MCASVATGSGQQPARFNQPISFFSSGVVGSDPMEIRAPLQRVFAVTSAGMQDAKRMQASEAAEPDMGEWAA